VTEKLEPMPKLRHYSRYAAITLVLGLAVSLNACSNHAGIEGPAPQIGFKTLKNKTPLYLSELGKPLLVSFWSTTCVVCLKEMPHLTEVYEEFKPKGFEMVAVAMPFDKPSDVVELSEGNDWPFLVAIDLNSQVLNAFGDIKGTPTAFLIDQDGNFVDKYVGAIDLKKFRETLTKLTDT